MNRRVLTALFLSVLLLLCPGCRKEVFTPQAAAEKAANESPAYTVETVPAFDTDPFVPINGNVPAFADGEKTAVSYEYYSELDSLGRCGAAKACIGKDLMPTEKRGEIGQVKPTGWKTAKYDFVDGKYLYNRCHLIGFQLSGENANEKNLITGTRYLNVQGMLPFENMVADYVKETGNHVLYRVTPVFTGSNLLADGVEMEAESVEDGGDGICFHVFCYNVQPGVVIDYRTGENRQENASGAEPGTEETEEYVLNVKSKKFHLPDCESVGDISEKNRQAYQGSRDNLLAQGYAPCARCHP